MRIKRLFTALIVPLLLAVATMSASAQVAWGVGVGFGGPGWGVGISSASYAPPRLPFYAQPAAPYPNYQWIPGYWGYGGAGYYWVPGYWTPPPVVGDYWTPGYWGNWPARTSGIPVTGGRPSVSTAKINYRYGYYGTGFVGGYWSGRCV